MIEKDLNEIKLRTNKVEQPKEIVLIQHIDRTFSFPLWIPVIGIIIGLLGEVIFKLWEVFHKIFNKERS
jgi:H+/Cl- antiporter ClcA